VAPETVHTHPMGVIGNLEEEGDLKKPKYDPKLEFQTRRAFRGGI